MTQEKWQQITGMIKDQFEVEEHGSEALEDVPNASVEYIIFAGPLGRMKLEYTIKPALLDKRTIGSKRMGSEATVTYHYSDTEFSNTFKAYKWDDDADAWLEMTPEAAGAFSV